MIASITPDVPFSLDAAAAFGFGPNMGRPSPEGGVMRLAFVTDDLRHQAGVELRQQPDGALVASIESDAPVDAVTRQVQRILSLDHPGREWLAVGERDPVIGRLQRDHPGLRPVLFHSPYEAAAWSVISARRQRSQAAVLRTRIAREHGRTFTIAGEQVHAFPLPERVLALDAISGLDGVRLQRLHGVAQAALDGALDPGPLRELEPEFALGQLMTLAGIGPTYATLILLRSTGVTNAMTFSEPRLASYVSHFYELGPALASPGQLQAISDRWRPFRTWTAVLVRVAGDRLGLPFEEPTRRR
jgi:DNA-3-methyladenine glycosylase II